MRRHDGQVLYSAVATEPPEDRSLRQEEEDARIASANGAKARLTKLSQDLSEQERSILLGIAKATEILGGMEMAGDCHIEKESIYGAALAIPQIARSARWPKSMFCETLRTYVFLLLNYFLQIMFVYFISDSLTSMNPWGGQMQLCDFASHLAQCPTSPDCVGPGGAIIQDPGALYPYDIWATRQFIKARLMAMFPDKDLDSFDTGEYGVESYYCRFLCIFVFVVTVADEFQNIRSLLKLLMKLPSQEGLWVQFDQASSEQSGKDFQSQLECVRFFVNGMPLRWKFFNAIFLLLPKIFLWRMLTMAGVHLLMETAAIVDLILNTTALCFVSETDELIMDRLVTRSTRKIMTRLRDYELFEDWRNEENEDEAYLARHEENEMTWWLKWHDWWLLPRRLCWSIALMFIFVVEYYYHNCRRSEAGNWISKAMTFPPTPHLEFRPFFLRFLSLAMRDEGNETFWSPP